MSTKNKSKATVGEEPSSYLKLGRNFAFGSRPKPQLLRLQLQVVELLLGRVGWLPIPTLSIPALSVG